MIEQEEPQVLEDLHFELNVWINELRFYKDEIRIFNHRMEEIVRAKKDNKVMANLEHFQNQYIRQVEVIDELRHDIKQHENVLEAVAEKNSASDPSHNYQARHIELKAEVIQFRKLYMELKDEFTLFLAGCA